jgi:hypothetical protein
MNSATRGSRLHAQAGMSLLELMLLVFVLGGALLVGYAGLRLNATGSLAQHQSNSLGLADRAVAGFAANWSRLPCPDSDGDGLEDCASGAQKGGLPYRTLALEGAQALADNYPLRYLVQRASVDLAVANDVWQPMKYELLTQKYSGMRSFAPASIGTPDLCAKLMTGGSAVLAAGHAQVAAAAPRGVAYAIAHAGSKDEDGNGSLFDASNADVNGNRFEPADRSAVAGLYDDRVIERSFASLAQNLNCNGLHLSLNLVSLGADMVEEVKSSEIVNTAVASVISAVNVVLVGISIKNMVTSAGILSTSAGYLTASTALLSAAIAGCAVIIGCLELPHAVASVAAAVAAVAASTAAVALNVVNIGLSVVATGLSVSAAIMAGISTNTNVDVSAAVAQALTTKNSATTKKTEAYNAWQAAINAEANLLARKDAAVAAVYQVGRNIMTSANAAAVPAGALSVNTLDDWVSTVVNRANEWSVAEQNYAEATQAHQRAVDIANAPGTNSNANMTSILTALQAQIDAESDPVKKQALIDSKASIQNGTNATASNSQQLAQLSAQINDLDAQIVASPAPSNLADLVALRDQLRTQRSNLTMDVASALAYKNAMNTARQTAYNPNYLGAYNNAINQSRIPYSVRTCTTSGSPAVTTCTTVNNTYDGSNAMRVELNKLVGGNHDGLIFNWYLKHQETLAAQKVYDAAVSNETQATKTYNDLVALQTGVAGSGAYKAPWEGGVPILQAADAKGGVR